MTESGRTCGVYIRRCSRTSKCSKILPPYSPFLNIVEQIISSIMAAIKTDISRPIIQAKMCNQAEARRQGTAAIAYSM